MPIAVGSKAPDFTLKTKTASGFEDVTLSSNFGSRASVLLFVPAAFSGTCTTELCDVSAGLASYSDLGAAVYGISVDSPFALEAWSRQAGISFPLLSDYSHEVCRAYGVELADFLGIGRSAARAAFVIDKGGVVRHAEQTPTPGDLPNFEAVKAALKNV